MRGDCLMMIILAAVVVVIGLYLVIWGKPSMIRERFSKGVSPENERKFMMATGGAIAVIGIDMMVLGFLDSMNKLDSGNKLIILAIGIVCICRSDCLWTEEVSSIIVDNCVRLREK